MGSTPSVGADISSPQRRGIELLIERKQPKVFEFVGGGNLSPLNVTISKAVHRMAPASATAKSFPWGKLAGRRPD